MTVKELMEIIKDLPDDMLVVSHDVGGYPAWDFCRAKVVTSDDPAVTLDDSPEDYPEPPRPYLKISA